MYFSLFSIFLVIYLQRPKEGGEKGGALTHFQNSKLNRTMTLILL